MTPDPSAHRVPVSEVISVLGGSIGDDTAQEVVLDVCGELGLDTREVTREDALQILERLTEASGTVGVAARFGRSRLMLKWARDDLRAR